MPKRTGDFNAWRLEKLSNPRNAANYLNAALEQSPDVFLDAVRDVIQARTVSTVAKRAGVTRESLYRSFSATGNPKLDTLQSVLGALGLKISGVEPQIGASSVAPLPEAGKPASFRKARRRRGVSGHSQAQLTLPFTATVIGSYSAGSNVGITQQKGAGVAALADKVISPVTYQPNFPPGFIYAMQRESYAPASLAQ